MVSEGYKVVFKGETLPGRDKEHVKNKLSRILRASDDQMDKLFSGKRVVIAKDIDQITAEKYKKAFEVAGAISYIEKMSPTPSPPPPTTPSTFIQEPIKSSPIKKIQAGGGPLPHFERPEAARGTQHGFNKYYDFDISALLSEAWRGTRGVKGSIWAACIILFLALLGLQVLIQMMLVPVFSFISTDLAVVVGGILSFVTSILAWPVQGGIFMIGLKRIEGKSFSYATAFNYFSKTIAIFFAVILMGIITTIGFILLIIPGIYLSVAYSLTIPIIVDQGLGPWQAMELSRKAIGRKWFKVFAVYLITMLIYMISMIPLGIGLIWTIPLMIMVAAVLYRTIFKA